MRMVRPRLDAPQITIAEEQDEFLPVTAALVRPEWELLPRAELPTTGYPISCAACRAGLIYDDQESAA